MKRPGFFHGVLAAAVFAVVASVFMTVLAPTLPIVLIFRLLVPALALAYILYCLYLSRQRTGRLTTVSLWTAMAIGLWILEPPLVLYLLFHFGAVWLIRSLYFYSSILSALLDLGLNMAALSAAYWAFMHSGSVFLGVWCLFLVQALFVHIPASINRSKTMGVADQPIDAHSFERARSRAEAALRQLFAQ